MRKAIIISAFLIITFLVIPVMGQTHLGFIGGINIANFSGDELLESGERRNLNYSSRTGFAIGGVLDLALSGNASLRFEPMYLQKGAEGEEQALGISIPFAYKLAYLEVPAFIKIAFGSSNTRPYIMAGPSLGILLGSDIEVGVGGVSASVDTKNLMSSTDFGLGFGGGVNFKLENLSIFLEARYALGLTDIFKGGTLEGQNVPDEALDAKTNGIQIMGGITFPLASKAAQ